jgi:hypothetical protein
VRGGRDKVDVENQWAPGTISYSQPTGTACSGQNLNLPDASWAYS